jgi:predicted membrane-bound spermidine synthase
MGSGRTTQRSFLLFVFIVSGFTGLIYESIWSHYLRLFLGHAAYAQTLVLAIFMGGMAVGSWLVARYSKGLRQLLLGYVFVEAVIGVLGLVFHRVFVFATDLSFDSIIPALESELLIHLYKWSLAALLILPQSILLGMTFPLMSGGVIRRFPERPGEVLSMLYFTNCLGAALGVIVSGFVLIRAVGLPGTILTAGLLNIALALVIWVAIKGTIEPQSESSIAAPGKRGPGSWFIGAAFLTGCAAFVYEIGWIRMLSLVLGSSTHSFELMLSAFILGLAFGGLWIRRRIDAIADPRRWLGIVMIGMGGLALLTLPAYNLTFDFMAWALQSLAPTEGGYLAFNLASHAVAVAIMLPTTFCAGMTLPLITHALLRSGGGERAIGLVYAANTLGAIGGVLLAVHVLLPLVGVKIAIVAGAAIHMALGISGLWRSVLLRAQLRFTAAAFCIVAIVLVPLAVEFDPLRMTSSVYRTRKASPPHGTIVRYLRDGKTATISLAEQRGVVVIATNGKPDAGIQMQAGPAAKDEITMIMAAALPLAVHPNPKRIANIGFGSGLTSHTLLGSSAIERLDNIEIEAFMVEAARLGYHARVRRAFDDPRSNIVIEDAKTFFAAQREPYDVIVSEPSNPWVSGVATLFSEEFYRRIVKHLKPDGYLVQWLQIYETDIGILASVMKALSSHFDDYALYNADDENVLILARPRGRVGGLRTHLFQLPQLRSELARVGIESVADIRSRRIGDKRSLSPLFASFDTPPNSDFFPFVDLNAPRYRYLSRDALQLTSLLVLPFPLIDMLHPAKPTSPVRPPAQTFVYRDVLISGALLLKETVDSGEIRRLPPEATRHFLLIDMHAAACDTATGRETWRRAVRELSDLSSPYLPPEELRALWKRIMLTPCGQTEGYQAAWAAFWQALAERDAPTIDRTGSDLLNAMDWPRSTEQEHYLRTVVATARLVDGRHDAALRVLSPIAAEIESIGRYSLAMRWLLALASSDYHPSRDPPSERQAASESGQ